MAGGKIVLLKGWELAERKGGLIMTSPSDFLAISVMNSSAPGLRRELGLLQAVGIGLGAVLGAGVFVVTGVAACVAGPAFLVGLVVAGVAATCNGLSAAQLAAVYPQAGGTYEYGYRVVSPAAGFAAGWMFLLSKLAAAGTVALGLGHYLAAVVPGFNPLLAAVVAVVGLTAANLRGIKKAGALNLVIVSVTVTALGAFVLGGLPVCRLEHFQPFAPQGWRGVAESSALLFFAYTGYARLATLGEEVRHPETTIPRAILLTLGLSFGLYLAVGIVAVGSVGAPVLGAGPSPLEKAAATFPLPRVVPILTVGAITAMLGVLLSQILGISRMMLAMARRGDGPAGLADIHPTYGVPSRGILATGTLILLLVGWGTLEVILASASFAILIYYALTNVAALRLPPAQRRYPAWVSWLGLSLCLAMAVSLPGRIITLGMGLLTAGFLLRWGWRRRALAERDQPPY